jgi:hypothetical protein
MFGADQREAAKPGMALEVSLNPAFPRSYSQCPITAVATNMTSPPTANASCQQRNSWERIGGIGRVARDGGAELAGALKK